MEAHVGLFHCLGFGQDAAADGNDGIGGEDQRVAREAGTLGLLLRAVSFLVGEALSTRAGVPIVPYAKGYAVGNVMSMRISDGDVYNLKLPKPDYEIGVELSALRKVKYGGAAAGECGSRARPTPAPC